MTVLTLEQAAPRLGVVAPEPCGDALHWEPVFIPDGSTQTLGEMMPDQKLRCTGTAGACAQAQLSGRLKRRSIAQDDHDLRGGHSFVIAVARRVRVLLVDEYLQVGITAGEDR